jgi:hypothetical protein
VSASRPEQARRRPLDGQSSRSGGVRGRRAPAPGGGGGRRLARTILLGTVAAVAALVWLSGELELDRDELLGYAATSVLLVAVLVLAGALLGGLLWFIRRERGPRDRDQHR